MSETNQTSDGRGLAETPCSAINPGIAETLEWLNENGYRTTDSGDGKTHDFECDQPVPYVHMIVAPELLVQETRRLVSLLAARGIALKAMDETGKSPTVEASYLPIPGIATISLWNVLIQPNEQGDSPRPRG